MRNPIDASQHQRPYRNEAWNSVQHFACILRQRSLTDSCWGGIAELFDVDTGQDEHAGAADFVKPVNARNVRRWILSEPLLCLSNQVVAYAEPRRACGADLSARRLLAGHDTIRAHNAFAHSGIQ